jgi:hypothetical protein
MLTGGMKVVKNFMWALKNNVPKKRIQADLGRVMYSKLMGWMNTYAYAQWCLAMQCVDTYCKSGKRDDARVSPGGTQRFNPFSTHGHT